MKPMPHHPATPRSDFAWPAPNWQQLAVCGALGLAMVAAGMPTSQAADAAEAHDATPAPAARASATKKPPEAASAPQAKELAIDIKAALRDKLIDKKNLILLIKDKPSPKPALTAEKAMPAATPKLPVTSNSDTPAATRVPSKAPSAARTAVAVSAHVRLPAVVNPRASRDDIKARAAALAGHDTSPVNMHAQVNAAHGGEAQWAYVGDHGPHAWGKLKPEFSVCANGKRQSPINIEESMTLQGPAEPLQFSYTASSGTVVNNGHTIQVDMLGDNTLTVRGSVYKLVELHFHTPSGDQVNGRSFAMVAHLVHRNNEGQLAEVAVLIDPGEANPLIHKVWTYMPIDTGDRVRMPASLIDMNELLPKDQHYYQFIGSRTMPPCTEGVLWMVLKQPTQLSAAQIRLFQQLFPNNARPVQPTNGRAVRDAQ